MTLQFLRTKIIEVEPLPDGSLSVSWRLSDDLLKAEVNLIVQPPELEIIEATARLERYPPLSCQDAATLIKKVEGVSVGSGLRKILAGLLGGSSGCSLIMDAVLECANAAILHFTRPGIEAGESVKDPDQKLAGLRERLKTNPRLVRSCIAFQDDSPIMVGLNL